jgi:hypothetical protein
MPRIALLLLAGGLTITAAENKPRIYITESGATEITTDNLQVTRNTSPQNIEVMKAFQKQCPDVTITANRDKADYVVRFDHPPSPPIKVVKGNKVAVFDKNDDLVFSDSSRLLSSTVKSACSAIAKHAKP